MKVEVWSDIMCPFCYIGKRKFEAAFANFPNRESIEVIWRSFQLDPEMSSSPGKSVYQYLAERKGQTLEWSTQMHAQVTETAAHVGLEYNYDKAVVANSWNAHRLIQMAGSQTPSLGDAAEEALFRAYFSEGKDIGDVDSLVEIAASIGINSIEAREMLESEKFSDEVAADIELSRQFGVRGVPFFAFDRKYAVSGAQEPEVFSQVLRKSFDEWQTTHPMISMETSEGESCTIDGECN